MEVIRDYADQYRDEAKAQNKKHFCGFDERLRDRKELEIGCFEKRTNDDGYPHKWYFHYGAYVKDKHIKNIVSENELDFETIAKERLIAGTPEQCLEAIEILEGGN